MKTRYCEVRVKGEVEVVSNITACDDLMKRYADVNGAEILPVGTKTLGKRATHAHGFVNRNGRWWSL